MIIHETKIRVRYAETDQMGVVYYGNYAAYFEVGRAEFIRERGLTYADMENQGVMMPVTELTIKYFRPAFYDQLVTIRTIAREIPEKRINLIHEVYNEAGELLVSGTISLAFIDAATRKPMRAPDFFKALFSELETPGT